MERAKDELSSIGGWQKRLWEMWLEPLPEPSPTLSDEPPYVAHGILRPRSSSKDKHASLNGGVFQVGLLANNALKHGGACHQIE